MKAFCLATHLKTAPALLCYLGGSVVEHLLPGGIQGVLAISQQALLGHIDHLPGSCVHGNGSLVAQSCLLSLLLCLWRADAPLTNYSSGVRQGHNIPVLFNPITVISLLK